MYVYNLKFVACWCRDVVIKLLQGKNKGPIKKLDVTVAAQEELGREISNNEYNKVKLYSMFVIWPFLRLAIIAFLQAWELF